MVVCQRHSHTHTRAEFVSKHHRSPLLEAPLAWCAVRSHNSDPTSSGQAVTTVNQNCGELFSIARFLRARERVRYASAPLSEDSTSVRGPQTENPPWARALNWLSRFGVCLKLASYLPSRPNSVHSFPDDQFGSGAWWFGQQICHRRRGWVPRTQARADGCGRHLDRGERPNAALTMN